MKIAYISTPFLADCDLPLLRSIRHCGHEVFYFLMISPSSQQATIINIPMLEPNGALFPAYQYPSLTHLKTYLPLDQIYVVNMPKAHDWHPLSLKAVWDLERYISRKSFDVVHVTSPLRYGNFLLYALRRKMVMTIHDPLPHSSDQNSLNKFHRWMAFCMVKNFIILSKSLKEEFVRKCHLERKNVFVTGLSTYDVLLKATPEPMSLPKKYILFAGSINPHKGIKYLCEAMKLLNTSHKDLNLIIAGRGIFDFDIYSYTAKLPIKLINRFVTDGELVSLIRGAVCVVCPYIDATQSGVIMSSFALQKPVIATNVGAIHEMFSKDKQGLIVPPRDSGAIAQAISHMLKQGVAEEMSKNIIVEFSQGNRSWANIAKETIAIYHNITKK